MPTKYLLIITLINIQFDISIIKFGGGQLDSAKVSIVSDKDNIFSYDKACLNNMNKWHLFCFYHLNIFKSFSINFCHFIHYFLLFILIYLVVLFKFDYYLYKKIEFAP